MASTEDSATSTGYRAAPGGWSWPDDLPSTTEPVNDGANRSSANASSQPSGGKPRARSHKQYRPRQCRICLETVYPTFHTPPVQEQGNLSGLFPGSLPTAPEEPTVSYDSESGRLLRPCKCKGSSRYVHEGCLQQWRHADPEYGRRNYWQCPTCGFRYRLERMQWGRWISSTPMQMILTVAILLVAMFILGFVADPIINLYFDPYSTILSSEYSAFDESIGLDEKAGWTDHFVKGFASLGVLGFIKVFFTAQIRYFSFGGSRRSGRGQNGRDRFASVNGVLLLLGVLTVLLGVWKGVRAWSKRFLKKTGERVVDVQGDDDDDDDDDETNEARRTGNTDQ